MLTNYGFIVNDCFKKSSLAYDIQKLFKKEITLFIKMELLYFSVCVIFITWPKVAKAQTNMSKCSTYFLKSCTLYFVLTSSKHSSVITTCSRSKNVPKLIHLIVFSDIEESYNIEWFNNVKSCNFSIPDVDFEVLDNAPEFKSSTIQTVKWHLKIYLSNYNKVFFNEARVSSQDDIIKGEYVMLTT